MMIKLCKLTHKGEILKYKGAGDGAGPCTCSAPQCTLGKIYPMRPPAWIGNTKIQGGWSQGWIPHVRAIHLGHHIPCDRPPALEILK